MAQDELAELLEAGVFGWLRQAGDQVSTLSLRHEAR
jgi:hypothetical protein